MYNFTNKLLQVVLVVVSLSAVSCRPQFGYSPQSVVPQPISGYQQPAVQVQGEAQGVEDVSDAVREDDHKEAHRSGEMPQVRAFTDMHGGNDDNTNKQVRKF